MKVTIPYLPAIETVRASRNRIIETDIEPNILRLGSTNKGAT